MWLAKVGKGMWFECEQPFVGGALCDETQKDCKGGLSALGIQKENWG